MRALEYIRGVSLKNKLLCGLLLIIALLGWELRFKTVTETESFVPIQGDAIDYYSYAFNLRNLGVYSKNNSTWMASEETAVVPDAVRPPGYPLLILPMLTYDPASMNVGKIKHSIFNIKLSQAVVSTLTIFLAYLLFKSFLPTGFALSAAFLTAISPHLVAANANVLTETVFCFFVVAFLWACVKYIGNRRLPFLFVACLLLGVSALVRPSSLYFIVPMVGCLLFWLPNKDWKKILIVSLVGLALVVGPWMARNMMQDLPSDRLAVLSLYHGVFPNMMYQDIPESYGYAYRFDPNSQQIVQNRDTVLSEVLRRFSEEPARHLGWYLFGKPATLWQWDLLTSRQGDVFVYPVKRSPYFENKFFITSLVAMKGSHTVLLLLAVTGVALIWLPFVNHYLAREAVLAARMVTLFLLYFTFLHMVAAPYPRYSIPVLPLMYGAAMLPLMLAYMYWRRKIFSAQAHCKDDE